MRYSVSVGWQGGALDRCRKSGMSPESAPFYLCYNQLMRNATKADLQKIQHTAEDLMRKNRRVTDGHLYTVPAPVDYPYQWLWDSCFHAIILTHFDLPAAKAELLSA